MTRFRRDVRGRLERLEHAVDQISRSIEKIEVATIVREPSSKLSVDAYDGLRRQVVAAAGERMAHLVQLVQFTEAVARTHADELAPLVEEWLTQAGVERVSDAADSRYYDVLGGEGSVFRVLRMAYQDSVTGRPIQMGQVELVDPARADGAESHRSSEPTRDGAR